MKKQKKQKQSEAADLRFRHLDLANNLAEHVLKEMISRGLGVEEIPYVLNDLCKVIILAAAEHEEDSLYIVKQFVELNTDFTCLVMRIVTGNYGQGVDSLIEETNEPKQQ